MKLGNCTVFKRFPNQTLLWPLEFVIIHKSQARYQQETWLKVGEKNFLKILWNSMKNVHPCHNPKFEKKF